MGDEDKGFKLTFRFLAKYSSQDIRFVSLKWVNFIKISKNR